LALAALVGAGAWFVGPAQSLSRSMLEKRARTSKTIQLHHLVLAVVALGEESPGELPSGDDARAALEGLEEALALEEAKSRWSLQALAVLNEAQIATAQASVRPRQLTRDRGHPFIPPEMLRLEALLSESFGSAPADALPPPDTRGWRGGTPQDILLGLLGLVEAGEPPLSRDQARSILAALLVGMEAHDSQPELVDALGELLGAPVMARASALSGQARDAGAAERFAPSAARLLAARARR